MDSYKGPTKWQDVLLFYCVHTYVHTAINRVCAEVDIWFVG